MLSIPTVTTTDGVVVPRLGYAVFPSADQPVRATVEAALAVGHRHLNTTFVVSQERTVGMALAESGIPRDRLFVTTKVAGDAQGRDDVLRAADTSLTRLGPVDLYLAGAPVRPAVWRAMEELVSDGRVRAIGVADVGPDALEDLIAGSRIVPAVNQLELHPYRQRRLARTVNAVCGVVTAGWSPPAGALFDDAVLARIALRHRATIAQVALAWSLDVQRVALVRSLRPEHMRSELAALTVALDGEEHDAIAELDHESIAAAG